MRNKKDCQFIHAKRRLAERFSIDLSRKKHEKIINIIQNGECKHIKKQSNRISIKEVIIDDLKIKVVYDRNRKSIVTFF